MALIVQKYGGSSVADAEKIKNVARRITATRDEGKEVVVAVSAMGKTTDNLVSLAYQVNEHPDGRELDALLSTGELVSSTLLAMALAAMGYQAISLSGAQAGIRTTASHRRARILNIEPRRIFKELEKGNIVIIAGFQGITEEMDVTTLGRGASDTTAVALAASLKAEVCQIYTDVEGVYTADPRVVPEAQPLEEIGYEEMLELASHGAGVMHGRAVELGELYEVPIQVSSSFTGRPGTLIHGGVQMEVRNKVRSIAHDLDIAKITVVGVPDQPGIAAALFEPLAGAGISVDTIVQNASIDNITDLTFTVAGGQEDEALKVVEPIAREIGARDCVSDSRLGQVSIVGTGMQNTPGFASRMFSTLSEQGINIQVITTSEIRITCIIEEGRVEDAVRALHRAFRLDAKE
jgi:aspartate kinase